MDFGKIKYKKIVYISHGYGGKEFNKKKIEYIIKVLCKAFPDFLFISPVHTFGFLYNFVEYNEGLRMCLHLLNKCDEMWVVDNNWQESKGVKTEIEYCKKYKIPFVHLDSESVLKEK